MLTELGVRGGPSLSLSLARTETYLVIDGLLLWCGPDTVGSLGALAWPMRGFLVCFSCGRDVGLLFGFFFLPRAVAFLLGCVVGCARMWVFVFVFLV